MIEDVYSRFPLEFIQFLNENNVDPAVFAQHDLPRYVRVNPRNPVSKEEYLQELQSINPQINCRIDELEWIPNF